MIIIPASAEILKGPSTEEANEVIELAGRVCYKSEDKISESSAKRFIESLIKRGHESVLEHAAFTAKFICDRGVSHEIVRHRVASYSQESTRYVNYGSKENGIVVVDPCFWERGSAKHKYWQVQMKQAEEAYLDLLEMGASPQEARAVLPNSLKTEVIMTANMREWRHFFKLRISKASHPQMREVAIALLRKAKEKYPIIFADIEVPL